MLPVDYDPTKDHVYMSAEMLEYFRLKLIEWRKDILRESGATRQTLAEGGNTQHADANDRATVETDRSFELRARDRQRKLITKINEALNLIASKEYGYCEDTGEPIGVERLMARPMTTRTVEAQERWERIERIRSEGGTFYESIGPAGKVLRTTRFP